MKIAAQLYTLREFLKTPEDIKSTLKRVKQIGYDAVQISALGPIEPEVLNDYRKEIGIEITSSHSPLSRVIDDTKALIKEHKLWDCKYIGIGGAPAGTFENEESLREFIHAILPACKEIKEEGLQFTYHNHHHEFEKNYGGKSAMDIFLESSPEETFGLLPDLYWLQYAGVIPTQFLKQNSARIKYVHYKDLAVVNRTPTIAAIGEGNLDWVYITKVCEQIGVEWLAVEQDVCPRDPFDCLLSSRNYLKKINVG